MASVHNSGQCELKIPFTINENFSDLHQR